MWAVDDTLCRKRGLSLHGAGMHHDPLISSRAKPLVSWGHDWVVLCLLLVHPSGPHQSLRSAHRHAPVSQPAGSHQRQKNKTKAGKTKPNPNHRTRPQLAVELISLVAAWFPHDDILVTGDSAYGGKSVLSRSAQQRPPHQPCPSQGRPVRSAAAPPGQEQRPATQEGRASARHGRVGRRRQPTLEYTDLPPIRPPRRVAGQDPTGPLLQGRRHALLTIVLTRDRDGKRPDQMFYCTKLDWTPRQILTAYSYRWAIECTFSMGQAPRDAGARFRPIASGGTAETFFSIFCPNTLPTAASHDNMIGLHLSSDPI